MLDETWERNKTRINQLWPDVNWQHAEKELWHEELSELNQNWLTEAIKNVAKTYSSPKPKLVWITKAFTKVKKKSEADAAARQAKTEIKQKQQTDAEAEAMAQKAHMEMVAILISLAPDRLQALAKKVQMVLGLRVDVSMPPQTWSRTAVGCMIAAHNKLDHDEGK